MTKFAGTGRSPHRLGSAAGAALTAGLAGALGSRAVSKAVTVTGNRTFRNGRFGIEATAAIRDGGGNVASGNHASVQCTGVVCRPAP
jgi:hypothetical protein